MADIVYSTNDWGLPSSVDVDDGVTNAFYRIWMTKGPGLAVSTPMPENWTTQLNVSWQPQFAGMLQTFVSGVFGAAAGEAINNIMSAGGYQMQNKSLSAQIWQGTSYLELQIPFVFKVEKDPEKELTIPLKKIMKMALPKVEQNTGLLQAPYNPVLQSLQDGKGFISNVEYLTKVAKTYPVQIRFGNFFKLDNCIITNISPSYDSIFDDMGRPLSAKVDVSISSTYLITYEDVDNIIR